MVSITDRLELRPAAYEDPDVALLTAQVQDYYRQIYGGSDDAPMSSTEFAPPNGLFLLGLLDGQPVAIGGWRFVTGVAALGARRPAEVKRMYVAKQARRRGLARTLLGELERTAAAAGSDALVLAAGRAQPDALRLYRACGFVDIRPFGYYADLPDAVHLGKALSIGKG